MGISIENYSLYRFECMQGEALYLLTCVYNPEYPNWLGPAETWAWERCAELTDELAEKFEKRMEARAIKNRVLVGEWSGGLIESGDLEAAEQFSTHQIWYSLDTKYPGLFVFEICGSEDRFWESIKELELAGEGIEVQNLTRPAKQLEVYYLFNDIYNNGRFPYKDLGPLGWGGA